MDPRPLLLVIAILVAFLLVRKAVKSWIGVRTRKDMYRELELQQRSEDREMTGAGRGSGAPDCPVCGGPTRRFQYPHLEVWRCSRYPECRGFLKAESKKRPGFATDWEKKQKKRG